MMLRWWWEDDDTEDEADTANTTGGDARRSKADVFVETGRTPTEYVLVEIEANGGRMKQQAICEFTGWSDGAISELLSQMEADGTITRGRIGLEKVVYIPETRSGTRPAGQLTSTRHR